MSPDDASPDTTAVDEPPATADANHAGDPTLDAEAHDLRQIRLDKIEALRARGVDPYPARVERDREIGTIRDAFGSLEAGSETDEIAHIAGRVMLVRDHGKLVFATLRDRSGEIQLFVSQKVLGAEAHAEFIEVVDRGDWIGVSGRVMVTRRGELSVEVRAWSLLAKAVRPLPEKWKGLADVDTRYRQRYVDLITNEDARRTFDIRIKAVQGIRAHLLEQGYLEVETPALSLIQGGATARPFITHYNALDTDTYLRIALELPLKRLIVGGMERVFEIGRVFRNEGIDTRHNPEFTMLEAYQAFADYHDMMALTEALVVRSAREALGTTVISIRDREVDLATPWRRATMVDLIEQYAGVDISPAMPIDEARRVLDGLGLDYAPDWGAGRLTTAVYDEFVEQHLVEPTFVIDHPREVSPLAKAKADDPTLVERFELVVDGRELANAYSELNDPVDQLARFEDEASAKQSGDVEAGDVDLDYIRALEYGLPPTGGLGIGIDRLVMLLSGQTSIREVILFPTLRPEEGTGGLADTVEHDVADQE
jgi:lysyl-tRNA synthetase class 2